MADPRDYAEKIRKIRQSVSGYREAQIYITFARLGLGEVLAGRPLPLTELSRRCSADEGALGRFVDAAIAFGLLERDERGYIKLTEISRSAMVPGSDQSIARLLALEGAFYERWGRLTEAVRTGQRPPENRVQEDDPGWVRMFTLALLENARSPAPAIAEAIDAAIPDGSDQPLHLIDIGGGHGAYSLAIARRRQDIHALVFDLPPVIEVTRGIVAESDVADRVQVVAGDFHVDSLGKDLDVALLFGVLHGETPENAPKLLKAIYDALKPGGLLLIRSRGRDTGEPEPGERELFDLHMLLSTDGGEVRRQADTTELVEMNGFRSGTPIEIPEPAGGQLLVFVRDP